MLLPIRILPLSSISSISSIYSTVILTSLLPNAALSNDTSIKYSARVRYETVEQNDQRGEAVTLKGRITLKHPLTTNTAFHLQFDHVEAFLEDQHSNGLVANGEPLIADPEGSELNQIHITHRWNELETTFGRFELSLTNERLIGSVGFRQNDQTFDGLLLNVGFATQSTLSYAYLGHVHRLFGDEADRLLDINDTRFETHQGIRPTALLGDHRIDAHLIHVDIKEWDYLESHLYLLSLHNHNHAPFSNRTVGLRNEFRRKFRAIDFFSNIDVAFQQQQQSSHQRTLPYYLMDIGAQIENIELRLREERLGERDGEAFMTPLATLHKFQGWTDLFVNTPNTGLIDRAVTLTWKPSPITIDMRFHRFFEDRDHNRIGDEIDLDVTFKRQRKHEWKIRMAYFETNAEPGLIDNDVKKLFVSYAYQL